MTRRSDPLALVAGLVFIAIAAIGLTDRIQLSINDVRWIAPILLVLFGILLLATAANGSRRSDAGGDPDDTPRDAQPDTTDLTAPQPPTEGR